MALVGQNGKIGIPMLSCKEASTLYLDSHDRPLAFRERFGLRMHLMVCRLCPRFADQMNLIWRACAQAAHQPELLEERVELPDEAKARILKRLASQNGITGPGDPSTGAEDSS